MSVRVAVAGLGAVADRIHLPACRAVPEIEIVGACDPDPAARERLSSKFSLPRTFVSVDEMLLTTRPDVLIVGTPPDAHAGVCLQAIDCGVHVFCEKPFTATLDEADRVIEAARAKNLLVRINNQYRYMTFYRETFERLQRGEFGRLFYLQGWQRMFHPPEHETNWRSGLTQNVLYEFGTHAFDLASLFFDARPVSINAHIPQIPTHASDVVVNTVLRFPDERIAALSFNRVSHAPEKYFELRLDCERASLRLSLGGVARFSVEWSRQARRPVTNFGLVKGGLARAEVNGQSRTYCSSRHDEFASATADHLRIFLAEMRQPVRPLAAAEHAREMLRLVFAAYDSGATGETVWLTSSGRRER